MGELYVWWFVVVLYQNYSISDFIIGKIIDQQQINQQIDNGEQYEVIGAEGSEKLMWTSSLLQSGKVDDILIFMAQREYVRASNRMALGLNEIFYFLVFTILV